MTTRPASECLACRRLRAAALGLIALLPLGLALLTPGQTEATAASAPERALPSTAPPLGPAAPAALAPRSAQSAQSAPAASAPELIHDRLVLVRLRVDQDWKGMDLVRHGQAPYRLDVIAGALPPGLIVGSDGWLRGMPSEVGNYNFMLRLADAVRPSEQRYRIEVLPTSGPRKPPSLRRITPEAASAPVDAAPEQPRSWRLDAKTDLAALLAPPDKGGEETEWPTAVATPQPTLKQLEALVAPLIDFEFPTEALLREALADGVCRYYRSHIDKLAETAGLAVDRRCPPGAPEAAERRFSAAQHRQARAAVLRSDERVVPASRAGKAAANAGDGASLSLAEFHAQLMSPALADKLVELALQRHPMAQAKTLVLDATPGCGCGPAEPSKDVYGLLAFWHGAEQAHPVDFGLFTRLSFLGALLDARGAYALSYDGRKDGLAFVREARRHGTEVDLMIFRREWSMLRSLGEDARAKFIEDAASNAVAVASVTLDDSTRVLHRLLLPVWRESDYAFDGITVFFDAPQLATRPAAQAAADEAAFKRFLHEFIDKLVQKMGEVRRPWRLNIVVPGDRMAEEGTYNLGWMSDVLSGLDKGVDEARLEQQRRDLFLGKGTRSEHAKSVSVRFLVLLGEPTSDAKKLLRERLDWSDTVKGEKRVQLLQNLVPVLLTKREGPVEGLPDARMSQLDDDFAYMGRNFGGLSLWPLPVKDRGRGEAVRERLARIFAPADTRANRVCAFVCTNRVPLRLLLQTLLLTGAISIGLYLWNCEVQRLGRFFKAFLVLGGLVAAVVAGALLSCDPDLVRWREANAILFWVMGLGLVFMAWHVLRPRKALA